MRLAKVIIRRFKSLTQVAFTIPKTDRTRPGSANFVSIVGENNAGKSSILEALHLACPGGDLSTPSLEHFPHGSDDFDTNPMEVEFHFDEVTDEDKMKHAIRAHVFEGLYRIKKSWKRANAKPEHYAFARVYSFPDLEVARTRSDLDRIPDWKPLLVEYDARSKNSFTKITSSVRETLEQIAIDLGSPCAREEAPTWSANPGGIRANLDTVLPRVIFVPAIQMTNDVADVGKRQSSVRRIVNMMFEEQLAQHETVAEFRRAALRVEELFDAARKHESIASVEAMITEKLKELIDIGASLKFAAPDVSADLASKTELVIKDGTVETKPSHQGHGAQRALVLALLQLLAESERPKQDEEPQRPILLLVEEPEIYLHPEMCRKMRDTLLRIARKGTAQVICTTHSPVFLDLADRHDGIVIVRKQKSGPLIIQRSSDIFERDKDGLRDRLRMILNFDPSANEAFFTQNAVLVEGDSEIATIDAVAERLVAAGDIDRDLFLLRRRRLTIINCRGKWTIPAFQDVLNAFEIPYRIVHDEDDSGDEVSARANASILKGLNGDEGRRLVHVPNFERMLFGQSWPKDKPWRATLAVRDQSRIQDSLLRFFEFALQCQLKELRPLELAGAPDPQVATPTPVPRLKGRRDRISRIDLSSATPKGPTSLAKFLSLEGLVVDNLEDDGCEYQLNDHDSVLAVRVIGKSMFGTVVPSDVVVIQKVDNAQLDPISASRGPTKLEDFGRRVWNDNIYIVAIDRAIERGRCLMRRVRFEVLTGGGWNCRVSADNLTVQMDQYRDHNIRRGERIKFFARLVGLAEPKPSWQGSLPPNEPASSRDALDDGGQTSLAFGAERPCALTPTRD